MRFTLMDEAGQYTGFRVVETPKEFRELLRDLATSQKVQMGGMCMWFCPDSTQVLLKHYKMLEQISDAADAADTADDL